MSDVQITELLSVDPKTKKIHLNDKRIVLMETDALGELRKDLISALGVDRAKGFLLRYGWNCGMNYARIFKSFMPANSDTDWLYAGSEIHAITGDVSVDIEKLHFDPETKAYYAEGYWHDSYEAEQHLKHYGLQHDPVCFTLVGYAGGYVSEHLGQTVIFREIECVGKGDPHCHWIAKPAEDWGEAIQDELPYYEEENLAQELDRAYIRIERQNERFQKVLLVDEQLSSALLHRKGLPSIIRVLGKQLDCTVVIEDKDFHLFESYGPYKEHDFAHFLRNPQEQAGTLLNRLTKQKRTIELSVPEAFGWPHQRLLSPIVVDNEIWGYLSLLKPSGAYSEMDIMCLERAATICAIQLLNERISLETEQRIKGEFLDAILTGDGRMDHLSRQMNVLGYPLNRSHYVLVFQFAPLASSAYARANRDMDEIKRELSSIISGQFKQSESTPLISSKLDQIVALIPTQMQNMEHLDPQHMAEFIVETFSRKYQDVHITVGISSKCEGIEDYRRGYEEAKKAIQLSDFHHSTSNVVSFSDLGFIPHIASGDNFDDMVQFSYNLLNKLIHYDRQNRSELIKTMHSYLECQGNVLKTSRMMNMSPGSIKYRLKRIEEISNIDLTRSSAFFDARLALKILQYAGKVEL